jgi:hypothetical protein
MRGTKEQARAHSELAKSHRLPKRPPFDCIALLLQGGGAPGRESRSGADCENQGDRPANQISRQRGQSTVVTRHVIATPQRSDINSRRLVAAPELGQGIATPEANASEGGIRVALTLRRSHSVFSRKQIFSAATPTGCKRFERGAGAVYKKRAGVFDRHHDDTTSRDENQVKKCENT